MRAGFTLLEVLIATAIASFLMTILFFSYNQINNTVGMITQRTDQFESAILIERQLTKDLSGAFIPVQAVAPKEKKGEKKEQQKDEQKQQPAPEDEGKGKKRPVLQDPFIGKNSEGKLSLLSFITNNPMRVYWGKKTGEPKPSIARVVYTLEAQKDTSKDKPRYTLYRQEGTELELAPYTKKGSAEAYILADDIVELKLTYLVADTEQQAESAEGKKMGQQEEKKAKAEQPPEVTIESFPDWRIEKDKKDIRSRLKLPDEVKIEVTIADELGQRKQKFNFPVRIAADFQELPEVKPPQKKQKPDNNKKDAANKAGKQQQKKQVEKREIIISGANHVIDSLRTAFGA